MRAIRRPKDLGAAIRQRRHVLGLTQQQVADGVGAGRQWVGALEAGKRTAEVGLVLSVLDTLGVQLQLVERGSPPRSRLDAVFGDGS